MEKEAFTDVHDPTPLEAGIKIYRTAEGNAATNIPHLCVEHSPTGFEFGYGGSGPADLALNLCEVMLHRLKYDGPRMPLLDHTTCFVLSWQLHQTVKRDLIAQVPDDGVLLPYEGLLDYYRNLIDKARANHTLPVVEA